MKRISKLLLVLFFIAPVVHSVQAQIKLPAIVSSNMVLQRNTSVELWGWADANEKITIEASWIEEAVKTKANKEG